MYNFQPGNAYSFNVHPVAILGNDFTNVTVTAILDQETANQFIDTRALHVQVYPTLPQGTPDDPSVYMYLKLKTASGNTRVIGVPWINIETVELVEMGTFTITIPNRSVTDTAKIQNALAANGITASNIVFRAANPT